MFRLHGTLANVKGAKTCPRSSLQQSAPASPCYGNSPSKDTFHPYMFGGEIAAGFVPGTRGISLYAGAGANRINPHFQVGFTDLNGNVDMTQVELENPVFRGAVFGGVTAVLREILDVGAQIYSVPVDATLFRLNGGIRFR